MPTKYLLTGVTGGLGAKILDCMLQTHHIPPSSIIATSRSAAQRPHFEAQGLHFRIADYNDPTALATAFQDVDTLLFMSSSTRDNATRNREHAAVVAAAKAARVRSVWYVSLALGGYDDSSAIGFQRAHYETEDLLRDSGLDFVSLRAGLYADAFPLFLNWYPSSRAVLLPRISPPVEQSRVGWTSRDEIGEGIATLLAKGFDAFPRIRPEGEKNVVLLTSGTLEPLTDLVDAINSARSTEMPVDMLEPQAWIAACAENDEGGKGRAWFEARLVFAQGICNGDAAVTDRTLETLLGRAPESGTQTVKRLLQADPEYKWHQNHMPGHESE